MFDWFKKKKRPEKIKFYPEEDFIDDIEESLWEIKDEYDLATEEVVVLVRSKRKNFDYIHKVREKIKKLK
jgi:septation ring formation regulator EzrA